jgi:hypothetical protein
MMEEIIASATPPERQQSSSTLHQCHCAAQDRRFGFRISQFKIGVLPVSIVTGEPRE